MSEVDFSYPLHRASLYIEELKYGPGRRQLEGATRDQIVGQLEGLLRDAGIMGVDPSELIDDCKFYGDSFARTVGVHPLVGKSLFVDGLMHGIALAGGLSGEPRIG